MTIVRNLGDLANQVDSSGTLGIGGGGTSATNATSGFNALAPSQTSNTNKYLTTNGTNTSWADVVSGMTVTALSYSGDDQAVDPSNPLPCTLTGTNFVAGSIVYVNTISAANSGTSINVTSSTSITFTPPSGLSAASYNVWIVSPTGTIAILANGILYSGAPSWAGQSTSLSSGGDVSIQLTATGDTPLTYSLVSGTLPTGTTLSSSGLISGTATVQGTFPNIVVKATDPESQDASVTIEITITIADAYFPYVTMLLHGDGANGAQNNTFVDSSTNNFTITRNGNTTQGSFSPYGSLWSNYFNGSNDVQQMASNSAWAFGTNDFTVECWLYPTSSWGSENIIFLTGTTNGFMLGNRPSGFGVRAVNNTDILLVTPPTLNTWTHIAVSRNGSTLRIFYNGVQQGSTSNSTNWQQASAQIGGQSGASYYGGYISNLRMVKGTALYTSNFTPSTTPLTAISGTSFLTCQSNRFIDNSSNSINISNYSGTPSVQIFSPFAPSSAYSTATLGGSSFSNAQGSYIATPSSTNFAIGSGDFTAECWFYPLNDGTGDSGIISCSYTDNWNIVFRKGNGNVIWCYVNGTYLAGPKAIDFNTWNHIALVRSNNVVTLYVNGVSSISGTISGGTTSAKPVYVQTSTHGTTEYIAGYTSDIRFVKGSAVYTSNFIPPTSPLSAIANTQLLLSCTNSGIIDNAMMNDLQTVGNAQVSTSVVKYGTGSMYFDGTGDYLLGKANGTLGFGTGDFTIEHWVYFPSSPANGQFLRSGDAANTDGIAWQFYNNKLQLFSQNDALEIEAAWTPSATTWYHVALTRSGTTLRIFVNGTQIGSNATSSRNFVDGDTYIAYGGAGYLNGYLDDLRITKGYARYTANFTPPTAAFPNT